MYYRLPAGCHNPEVTSSCLLECFLQGELNNVNRILETKPSNIDNKIYDQLILSYWAASTINDDRRMGEINNIFSDIAFEYDQGGNTDTRRGSFWFDPSSINLSQSKGSRFHSQRYGYLLADIPERYLTAEILSIRKLTKNYLSRQTFRSTFDNAKLVALYVAEKDTLSDIAIQIDGEKITDIKFSLPENLKGKILRLDKKHSVRLI